jgi:hypothetical protein
MLFNMDKDVEITKPLNIPSCYFITIYDYLRATALCCPCKTSRPSVRVKSSRARLGVEIMYSVIGGRLTGLLPTFEDMNYEIRMYEELDRLIHEDPTELQAILSTSY